MPIGSLLDCMLVFIQGSSVLSLALFFVSLSIRTEVAYGVRINFVFLRGANPNALWTNWDGYVSSLASLHSAFFCAGLPMCLQIGLLINSIEKEN
jgi:hypothetical protein